MGRDSAYVGSVGTRPPEIAGLTEWRPLARGGFAMVWQARQTTLNRLVAVKIDDRQLDSEGERRRFLREAGAAGRMSGHAGIVTVHDAGILPDDRPYLVMELCPGGSLNTWMKRQGRPDRAGVVEVGVRIADALAAAHAVGVIHRDVKPANILIDAYGHAGLADFGLAAVPEPDAPPEEAMDALTPAYAPPEVLAGEPATAAGDVYALSATLYAMLAGHSPRWSGPGVPTPQQIAALRGSPIEPIPEVDDQLMAVLSAGLADDPARRPSAVDLRDRLATAGRPVQPAAAASARSPAPGRAARSWLLVAAVAVIVLGLVSAVLIAVNDRDAGVAVPPMTTSAAPSSPTPTPTAAPVPTGFLDCSDRVGAAAVCPVDTECWTGVFSYMDSPYQATPQTCPKRHVYQTMAAVQLDYAPRRKSQIEADPKVKAVCNLKVLNRLLVGVHADSTWELMTIPPQFSNDTVYRCIFGKGTRTGPLPLTGG